MAKNRNGKRKSFVYLFYNPKKRASLRLVKIGDTQSTRNRANTAKDGLRAWINPRQGDAVQAKAPGYIVGYIGNPKHWKMDQEWQFKSRDHAWGAAHMAVASGIAAGYRHFKNDYLLVPSLKEAQKLLGAAGRKFGGERVSAHTSTGQI